MLHDIVEIFALFQQPSEFGFRGRSIDVIMEIYLVFLAQVFAEWHIREIYFLQKSIPDNINSSNVPLKKLERSLEHILVFLLFLLQHPCVRVNRRSVRPRILLSAKTTTKIILETVNDAHYHTGKYFAQNSKDPVLVQVDLIELFGNFCNFFIIQIVLAFPGQVDTIHHQNKYIKPIFDNALKFFYKKNFSGKIK
jgi:hypothetical protein